MSNTPETSNIVKSEAPAALSSLPLSRNGIQIQSMEDLFRFSKAVVAAGLAPKGFEKAESVFVAIQMGLELGISPMAALQNVAVINNRPKFYGSIVLALVRSSGLLESIEEKIEGQGDDRVAICITKRKGDPNFKRTTFSVKDARLAELWGTNVWKKYPERMLTHRARGFNLDDNFSDVLKGMASEEGFIELDRDAVTVHSSPIREQKLVVEKDANDFRTENSYHKMKDAFVKDGYTKLEVHWGTAEIPVKGLTLGEIEANNAEWFLHLQNKWQPESTKGKFNINDLVLRAALDASIEMNSKLTVA